MSVRNDVIVVAVAAAVGLVAVAYIGKKAEDAGKHLEGLMAKLYDWMTKKAAPAVGDAVNPTSTSNLVYKGASAVAGVFADYPGATLGTIAADIFPSQAERDVNAMLQQPPAANAATVPSTKSVITPVDLAAGGGYYDLGTKAVPNDASAAIGRSGVLTDSAYRDQVR